MRDTSTVLTSRDNAFVSGARVLIGLFFLGTGVVMFFVPDFRAAFNGQLASAGIPLVNLTRVVIPILMGVVGIMLVQGVLIRIASFVGIFLMALMTYLHVVVAAPTFYPVPFGLPLIPAIALVICAFLYFVDRHHEYT